MYIHLYVLLFSINKGLSKQDQSRKIANIFGLDDSPGSVAPAKPSPAQTVSNSADWLGLKDTPSPQKKPVNTSSGGFGNASTGGLGNSSFGRPSSIGGTSNIDGPSSIGGPSSNATGGPNGRRNSEVTFNQTKKWEKPALQEHKSLDLDIGGVFDKEVDSGEALGRGGGVQIKENLFEPQLGRGSRRSSLKVDSILNFDLAAASEDLKKKRQDGSGDRTTSLAESVKSSGAGEYNSLDSVNIAAPTGTGDMFSTEQKARDSRNQQNKDDLNSFFSMSSTTQPPRRPGLSRRRETSPNPVPTPPADQNNYDWLGTSTTKSKLQSEPDIFLKSCTHPA
uniref:Microtubule-associated protein Jupiter n=1 Tax=Cacopsylla melanoneura TaxID=428564 RepID=A0A8D9E6F4_9HEMI